MQFDQEYELRDYILNNFADIDPFNQYTFCLTEYTLNGYGIPDLIFVGINNDNCEINFLHVELKHEKLKPRDVGQAFKHRTGVLKLHEWTMEHYGYSGTCSGMLITKDHFPVSNECFAFDDSDNIKWYTYRFDESGMVLDIQSKRWVCSIPKSKKRMTDWCDKYIKDAP